MKLKILSLEEISDIYNKYMVKDFPPSELKPLERILETTMKGLCHSVGIYDGEKFVGYSIFIIPSEGRYGLLDYFAITSENRGKGYGHIFFEEVRVFFAEKFTGIEGFFIESEDDLYAENEEDKRIRTKRISFYKDCGCEETKLGSELFGVKYKIFLYNFGNCENLYGRRDLDYIYRKMFKPRHYKDCVSLWKKLDEEYSMSAKKLAPYLLGKVICRRMGNEVLKLKITETECYYGEEDTACHAHKGKTERTKVLYMKGGTSYVYLCYGIHSLFNVVSGEEGHPEAVLIRGVEGYSGPGKLTKAMAIDMSLNMTDMTKSDELWLEDYGHKVKFNRSKRVGIDYATPKYRDILWRYIVVE